MPPKDDKAKVGQDNKQTCYYCRSSYQNTKPGLCRDCTLKIYETKTISGIDSTYRALDGFNLAGSTLSGCYKVFYYNSSFMANYFHEDLLTLPGIIAATVTSLLFIGLSIFAKAEEPNKYKTALAPLLDSQNRFTQKEQSKHKKYIDFLWRLIRGIVKSFSNWFKALRTIASVIILAGLTDVNILSLPLGFGLGMVVGVSAVLVRLWTLKMQEERKNFKKINDDILAKLLPIEHEEILKNVLSEEQWAKLLKSREVKLSDIKNQSRNTQIAARVSAAYSGLLNSAYLYMGFLVALSAAVAWPVFIAMTAFCIFYCVLHVAAADFEEKEYERDLDITQVRAELAWYGNEIQKALALKKILPDDDTNIVKLNEKREELRKLLTLSPKNAVLSGIFNGLAVQRAVAAAVAFALLISPVLPPAVLIVSISIGLLFLAIFTFHAVRHYSIARAKQAKEPLENLNFLSEECKNEEQQAAKIKRFSAIIKNETEKKSDQLYVKDGAEIVRLMPSSGTKGWKGVSFPGNPALVAGADGAYHETPAMMPIMILSAIVQGIILPLRYLLKLRKQDNNKPKPENVDNKMDVAPINTLEDTIVSQPSIELDTQLADSEDEGDETDHTGSFTDADGEGYVTDNTASLTDATEHHRDMDGDDDDEPWFPPPASPTRSTAALTSPLSHPPSPCPSFFSSMASTPKTNSPSPFSSVEHSPYPPSGRTSPFPSPIKLPPSSVTETPTEHSLHISGRSLRHESQSKPVCRSLMREFIKKDKGNDLSKTPDDSDTENLEATLDLAPEVIIIIDSPVPRHSMKRNASSSFFKPADGVPKNSRTSSAELVVT